MSLLTIMIHVVVTIRFFFFFWLSARIGVDVTAMATADNQKKIMLMIQRMSEKLDADDDISTRLDKHVDSAMEQYCNSEVDRALNLLRQSTSRGEGRIDHDGIVEVQIPGGWPIFHCVKKKKTDISTEHDGGDE